MPLFRSASRALSTVTLFLVLSAAQQCFYPDGSASSDIPCSTGDSACCAANAWCMDNGLCFSGGLVSRGSCTDQLWGSTACTSYCRKASPSTSVAITPCTGDGSFSCGLDSCDDSQSTFSMSGSGSFVLRAAQVQALLTPALASAQASSTTNCDPAAVFTAGQLAAIGCALGIPLLIALVTIFFLFYSRRRQVEEMVPPLDPRTDIRLQPPRHVSTHTAFRGGSYDGSEHGASTYSRTSTSDAPDRLKSWSERSRSQIEKTGPPVRVREIRVELDASEEVTPRRHELVAPLHSPLSPNFPRSPRSHRSQRSERSQRSITSPRTPRPP